jgi:hypothetical protein
MKQQACSADIAVAFSAVAIRRAGMKVQRRSDEALT